jgi:hypothetical protein
MIGIYETMCRYDIASRHWCVPWNRFLRASIKIVPVAFNKSLLINVWVLGIKRKRSLRSRF